ncbi:O-antigen ligase family protein [Paraclostridium sp. AKS81]|nr:O-antigen ligase family protein [Paraclostridium sp. AKS81]
MNRSIIITDFNTKKEVVISFSKSNITQSIYLLFMVLFATILTLKLESKQTLINIIKVFSVSTVFALVWGLIQFCMYYLDIEYPAYIFNNNISAMQAYMQVVYGIKRISSIALEPSTFALNILTFLPFIVILWLGNRTTDKSDKKFNILLILIVIIAFICAILTTSSTAYIGLIISILILSLYVLKFSIKGQAIYENKIKIYILYLAAFITTIILLVFITKIFEISWNELISMLKNMTIDKVNSESGHERGNAIRMSLEIFKQVPILGAGWGSFRSLDMTTNLLANTGLIGLCSFIYIIYIPIKECILNRRINETISIALIFMIITPTIGLLISIPDLVFGYYWIGIVLGYSFWKKQN